MSGRGRFNTRSSNQGYQKQGYNTRNSHNNSPAFSTQQGYQKDHQQAHQPQHDPYAQQQQQPPAPQVPAASPPQQKPEPMPVKPVEVPMPVQSSTAVPPTTPKPENNGSSEADVKMGDEEEEGKKRMGKPSWFKRRTPDFRLPKRIRKRRQNARLKNILAPKNAMMVLHELHPELKMSVTEIVNGTNQLSYSVEIEIDGQTFKGIGMSKMAAKQAGSEAALKAVLLKKLEENNVKLSAQNAANKVEEGWDEDVPMTDVSETKATPNPVEGAEQNGAPVRPKNLIPEDDVPWGSLASFALYKLFSEWQSQGFQLPVASGLQNVPQAKPPAPAIPTPMKKLPDDAHTKHPVQLLNQIRPACQYIENREGAPPKFTFTFTVIVDDLTFKGVGSNKKDAKRQCAKHALEHLGVVYPEEKTN